MKIKRFLKQNYKTIIKAVLTLAVAIVAYIIAHKAGTAARGYEAIGGEIFIPFLIVFAEDIWGIFKAPFRFTEDILAIITAPLRVVENILEIIKAPFRAFEERN